MAEPTVREAIAKVEKRNPVWKVGPHAANSGRRDIIVLFQEDGFVLEMAIETSRWSSSETSKIRVIKYPDAKLNPSGQLGMAYSPPISIFFVEHKVEWELRRGLFSSGGKLYRPRHVPTDHDFLLQYVDKIAEPEYQRRAVEEADQLKAKQTDASKHRDAFFNS